MSPLGVVSQCTNLEIGSIVRVDCFTKFELSVDCRLPARLDKQQFRHGTYVTEQEGYLSLM